MKIPHIFFLTLTFLFLFSACKKDPYKYEVSGTVTEYGTNTPIAGAEVYLFDCTTDGSSTFCDTAQILITDAAGRYKSPFLSQAGRFPMVSAFVPQYFPSGQHFIREQNDNEIDFVLDPFAWLSVRVFNEAPAGEFDRIDYTYQAWTLTGSPREICIGQNVDKNHFELTRGGNRDVLLLWEVYDGGNLIGDYSETINIPAHDTLYYEIRY